MQQGSPVQHHPSMNISNQHNIGSSSTSSATAPMPIQHQPQLHMSNVAAAPQQIQQQPIQNGMHNMAQAPGGVYQQSQQQPSQQQPHYQPPQQYQQQPVKQQHQYTQQVAPPQQQQQQQISQQVHSQQTQQGQQFAQVQQPTVPQQQAPPPQHQVLTGGWQSDRDVADRRKMIAKIVLLLQQRKPNAPQEWLKKLPQMAKRLEESLYRSASSFEVYNDPNTLKYRLQQLAMNIGMKTQQLKNQQSKQQRPVPQGKVQQPLPAPPVSSSVAQAQAHNYQPQPPTQQQQQQPHQQYQIPQTQQQPQQQQQPQPIAPHNYPYPSQNPGSLPQQAQFAQQQKIQFQQQQLQNAAPTQPPRIVNLNEINSYMTPSNPVQQQSIQQPVPQPQRQQMPQQVSMPTLPMSQQVQQPQQVQVQQQHQSYTQQQQQPRPQPYAQVQQQPQQQFAQRPQQQIQMQQAPAPIATQQQVSHHSQLQQLQQVQPLPQQVHMSAPSPNNIAAGSVASASSTISNAAAARSASDRQQVLRHQQQRLLLLRHAAKCPHEDNRCPVTPHCAGMKRLWKHIAECKDQKCLVPHCVSSRYVLSHYHRCRDVKCPVCGPVREAIHRSHEKAKMLQKQREQQQTAEGTIVQPTQQHFPAVPVATQPTNAQTAQPFPPLVPPTGQHPQMIQELPTMQLGQRPVPPSHQQIPVPPPQQQQQQIQQPPSAKRQKTSTVSSGNRKPVTTPSQGVVSQQQPYPPQVQQQQQLQQQVQPPMTPSQSTPQMTPLTADSSNQRPNAGHMNGSAPQQGYVYEPTTTSSAAIAPITSSAGAHPTRVGPQLVNGQVIMPKHDGPKPQEDHTLINSFSIEQIETHIASLSTGLNVPPAKIKIKCGEVLKTLQNHQHAWVFNSPVDPVELGLPDYFQIIKRPMDLGTIKKRLENGCYHSVEDFQGDTLLTFENAMLYNQEGSVVHNMAKEMRDLFIPEFEKLMTQLHLEEEEKRKNGDACSLCGCEKLLFEPPVFYCNGLNCPNPGKRIRRNSYFYVNKNNQYHWCHQCWGELSEKPIEVGDVIIKKNELSKKKNDEIHEESWVQCDKCERWIHQICALFNTRQNKDQRSEYVCPTCTIDDRKKRGVAEGISTTPMAEDLPRTKLSEWLESHVRQKMKEKFDELSNQAPVMSEEGILLEPAKVITMGGNITIRQVTSMDRKLDVRERMLSRYGFKNYPSEFPFRCKCFVVFQNLDGVDVVLFGLYVYEHGADCPPPNHRTVYISYLDSVHYMRPRKMRTFIYHEILISYLDYVRKKGFSTAHIWACPPLKGDDYILYAKPEDQKTPKDDRLRQWYIDMLIEAQRRGIVGKLTNMYDLYFADEKNDATAVPYMDGDYFPAEVENVIKDIEEGRGSKTSDSGKKNKKKAKAKQKGNRGGTRSTGLDEEALKASGILPLGLDSKSIEEGARDFVMKKVGETIQPMKESFIVAYLAWEHAKPGDLEVPKEIMEARKKLGIITMVNDSTPNNKTASEAGLESESLNNTMVERSQENDSKVKPAPDNSDAVREVATENAIADAPLSPKAVSSVVDEGYNAEAVKSGGPEAKTMVNDGVAVATDKISVEPTKSLPPEKLVEPKVELSEVRGLKKRDADGEVKPDVTSSSAEEVVRDKNGKVVKVIDDDEEEMDCEFLNNRQAFLNLCQGNHYQFDQLRRAKHTSMMVLWHLHNRDAPKFVQQCANCSREILTGYRYHCQTCPDFDQCQECYTNPNTIRHPHPLQPTPVGGQQSQLTEAQRQERQRHIQLHMQLLQHAATCHSPKCPSGNCSKMKGLLRHGSTCTVKHTGGCNICKRIWALLQIHARQCKLTSCAVPNCMAIRERIRQLTKQQQAMDDRRRQEMNRTYRSAGVR